MKNTFTLSALVPVTAVLGGLTLLLSATNVQAAMSVVTPGEQNTQSGENGCKTAPCAGGHWLHYPELLQVALGADYTVQNNGDGGAVLGCDATTEAVAGGNSFCKSGTYTASIATPPSIVIIGPFGEHDQRIVTSGNNHATLYAAAPFEAAYEGLVQKYLKFTTKIYMMTPIDVPWGGTTALPNGENLVKDIMLPASKKIAAAHQITVIDTYTALTGTPELVTMYYANDGQVNAAGQQKMSDMIVAALATGTGMGGMGGAGGAGGAAGAGGAGGASAGQGGTGGTAGAGTAGSPGTAGAAAGSAGAPTGTAGVANGGSGGSTAGTGPTGVTAPPATDSSCTLSGGPSSSAWGSCLALLAVAGAAFARKRRAS